MIEAGLAPQDRRDAMTRPEQWLLQSGMELIRK
jgi:hypothetical protein